MALTAQSLPVLVHGVQSMQNLKPAKEFRTLIANKKWLPEREVDLMYLYSAHYLDARNPTPAETDFFTITRLDAWGESTWFMCTPEAAEKPDCHGYDNLAVKETHHCGIGGNAYDRADENQAVLHVEVPSGAENERRPPV